MKDYERLTNQEWSENIDLTKELGYSYIYKRLHELEDKIEQGTLKEVKIGKWLLEKTPDGKPYCFHCSVCDNDFKQIENKTKTDYCPNCGAKMQD